MNMTEDQKRELDTYLLSPEWDPSNPTPRTRTHRSRKRTRTGSRRGGSTIPKSRNACVNARSPKHEEAPDGR